MDDKQESYILCIHRIIHFKLNVIFSIQSDERFWYRKEIAKSLKNAFLPNSHPLVNNQSTLILDYCRQTWFPWHDTVASETQKNDSHDVSRADFWAFANHWIGDWDNLWFLWNPESLSPFGMHFWQAIIWGQSPPPPPHPPPCAALRVRPLVYFPLLSTADAVVPINHHDESIASRSQSDEVRRAIFKLKKLLTSEVTTLPSPRHTSPSPQNRTWSLRLLRLLVTCWSRYCGGISIRINAS